MSRLLQTGLTPKQLELFKYLCKFYEKKRYYPSIREMQKHFKKALSTLHQHLDYIEKKGFIKRNKGWHRWYEIDKEKAIDILRP